MGEEVKGVRGKRWTGYLADVMATVGVATTAYGISMISVPFALIYLGLSTLAAAFVVARISV